ncbi:MAG: recombinase family protein [Caldilineae bacterium]|nr:MAG: recombinase family protein [Caldilineae bacterium]
MKKHAIIYDRASTSSQKDNYSRVNAREVGIRIAEREGYTWEYVREVGSGTTLTGRPKMLRILDRIAAGEIQALIVQDLDRLARPEEAVVYNTIRQTLLDYGVIIYTHTSRIDLANEDDDFLADIQMTLAKRERRLILKRMHRGRVVRIEQGRFGGGTVPLGMKLVYVHDASGKPTSELAVDEEEAETVRAVFDALEATGGNLWATALRLNEQGFTGKQGGRFAPNTIRKIAGNRIYIGILESKLTDKIIHRPELQIISVEQFERVQALIASRRRRPGDRGRRGRYVLTGFVTCGTCGGPMVAEKNVGRAVCYVCITRREGGEKACPRGKTYAEHLVLPPIIAFIADLIQNQIDFDAALDDAARRYGKSITEEAYEAAVQGELASVRAGKARLVDAISTGVLTQEEAAAKLGELREQERRLIAELSSISEKARVREEWEKAVESLKGCDITASLHRLAESNPVAFRRLLGLVFKPNSLRVRTYRVKGNSWAGELQGYELTDEIQMCLSFDNDNSVGGK